LETPYDWITVAIFAGLIVLFLNRSASPDPQDRMIQYLLPSVGLAAANYFGNEQNHVVAIAILLFAVAYIIAVLKPFPLGGAK
jgi:hypothetical protein